MEKEKPNPASGISPFVPIIKILCITAVFITWLLCREPETTYLICEVKDGRIGITKNENPGTEGIREEEQYLSGGSMVEASDYQGNLKRSE